MGVSIKQSFDYDIIKSILQTDEMKVFYDEKPVINQDNGWFIVLSDGKLAGVIRAHHLNSCTIQIHIYMFKQFIRQSRKAIKEFVSWFIDTPESINKLVCMIPDHLKTTVNFAKKCGFRKEGYISESYMHNGEFVGMSIFGLTKKEGLDI